MGKGDKETEIPKEIRKTLGAKGSQRIDRMVRDVIHETLAVNYEAVRMSAEVYEALEALRDFMFERLYLIRQIRSEFEKAQSVLVALFEHIVKKRG